MKKGVFEFLIILAIIAIAVFSLFHNSVSLSPSGNLKAKSGSAQYEAIHQQIIDQLKLRDVRDTSCDGDDSDGDDIPDECDNCPAAWNPDQADTDDDGIGDACEDYCDGSTQDTDHDALPDTCDNCPFDYNPDQADNDLDGRGNLCDNCIGEFNPLQEDSDGDGRGDACDRAPGLGGQQGKIDPASRLVFVTSSKYSPPKIFISEKPHEIADSICQQGAGSAGLPGTYVAWISTSYLNAKDKILDIKYVRPDGKVVANNKKDLLDGRLNNPISLDQYGKSHEGELDKDRQVLTGTGYDGIYYSEKGCADWSDFSSMDVDYSAGLLSEIGPWWTLTYARPCFYIPDLRFYCFQVKQTTPPECNDGLDNDGDKLYDLQDADCTDALDNSESGSLSCRPIRTIGDLDLIRDNPYGCYYQMNDIDLGEEGSHFKPLPLFRGRYNGQDHVIRNLQITEASQHQDYYGLVPNSVGFFKGAYPGVIFENIKFINPTISVGPEDIVGEDTRVMIGVLSGSSWGPLSIKNVHVSGAKIFFDQSVYQSDVGCISGMSPYGIQIISSSCKDGSIDVVNADTFPVIGGLVAGLYGGEEEQGLIQNSYSKNMKISVTASSTPSGSYASWTQGGLAGYTDAGGKGTKIVSSWSDASIYGYNTKPDTWAILGGLAGFASYGEFYYQSGSIVKDSYFSGQVISDYASKAAGLIGENWGYIENSYSTGQVAVAPSREGYHRSPGGLVAYSDLEYTGKQSTTSSYWDTQKSGQTWSGSGEGKTTAQMKQKATFKNWDFSSIWKIKEGIDYPRLQWEA